MMEDDKYFSVRDIISGYVPPKGRRNVHMGYCGRPSQPVAAEPDARSPRRRPAMHLGSCPKEVPTTNAVIYNFHILYNTNNPVSRFVRI